MNYEGIQTAMMAMKSLNEKEKLFVINQLVKDEDLGLMPVICIETQRLERYRQKSRNDIRKLGDAGLHLADKRIKAIPKIKDRSRRRLESALVKTLLATGARKGTISEQEINASLDYSEIDEKWYRECWALQSVGENE